MIRANLLKVFSITENIKGSIRIILTICEKEIDIVRVRLKSFKIEGVFSCMICLAGI